MSLSRTGPPAAEPVTLAEALTHLKESADAGANDAYITSLISVAREACESQIERTLISTPWRLTIDRFPCAIRLDMPPIIAVQSVQYIDADGLPQTLHPDDYQVDLAGRPGYIVPAPDVSWPAVQAGRINAVTVNYTAGHGSTPEDVPMPLRQWILLAIGEMYANRDASSERPVVRNAFADALLAPYRVMGI